MDRHNTIQLFVEAQMGRREFLGNLFKLSALGLAPRGPLALPLAGKALSSLPTLEAPPAPYNDPARAAVIEEWVGKVNQTIVTLETFWTSLITLKPPRPPK